MSNLELYSLMAIVFAIGVHLCYKYKTKVFSKEVCKVTIIRLESKTWTDVGVEYFIGFNDSKSIRKELRKHPQWNEAHIGSEAVKTRYKILNITYRSKYSAIL